jgi:hypothetical protein
MLRTARFCLSPFVGIVVSVTTWMFVTSIHPIFGQFSASGLVPAVVAGVLGGFISALLAPNYKVLMSLLVGLFLTTTLLLVFYRHEPPWSRNLWFWWWPIWVVPSYVSGGYLGRRYWLVV